MKKTILKNISLFLLFGFVAVLLSSCEKEKTHSIKKSVGNLDSDLQILYAQMPAVDFGIIEKIGDGILRFKNEKHYENTLNSLIMQCDYWSYLFFDKVSTNDEDVIDSLVERYGFDEFFPLQVFEEQFEISGLNLRAENVLKEKRWLKSAGEVISDYPFDSIINTDIEQTLISKHYEVCINNIIYQLRDSLTLLIPITYLSDLTQIRNLSPSQILDSGTFPGIMFYTKNDGCYKSYHYKSGEREHPEVGPKKFFWSFNYQKSFWGHKYVTRIVMKNYKKNKRNKWVKDFVNCTLGQISSLWSYEFSTGNCSKGLDSTLPLGTPTKAGTKVRLCYSTDVNYELGRPIQIGPIEIYPKYDLSAFHINPIQSRINCRHSGYTYSFNVKTGALE